MGLEQEGGIETVPCIWVTLSEAFGKGVAGNFQLCDLQRGSIVMGWPPAIGPWDTHT